MIGKRRDYMAIVADIVDFANGTVKKTHIMEHCNLSFWQSEKYLPWLLEKGFLEIIDSNGNRNNRNNGDKDNEYIPTNKGREFLERYKYICGLVKTDVNGSTSLYINGIPLSDLNGKNGLHSKF